MRTIVLSLLAALALAAAAAVPALTATRAATPAAADTGTTVYACIITSTHKFTQVATGQPLACPAGSVPVSWPAQAGGQPSPTPTPTPSSTSPSPVPTGTTPAPTPTATSPAPTPTGTGAFSCVTSSPSGNCGPYDYPAITNSNGYNTYVGNNCWADPSCSQVLSANSPGDWQVTSTEPAGNTAVKTYPDVQQLFNDWTGGGWNGSGAMTDTPVASLASLSSSYAETTPRGGTIGQFAWDIWTSGNAGYPGEIMVWVDNSGRGDGGATQVGQASIGGQDWTAYEYGTGEFIWSLDAAGGAGTFAQQGSGTVDLLALLHWMQSNGFLAAGAAIGQIDAGWEICSTGGAPETFAVSRYTLTASA